MDRARGGPLALGREFLQKCGQKGPTITVIKTKKGYQPNDPHGYGLGFINQSYIFGGASDKQWLGLNPYAHSSAAFLFCISCHGDMSGGKNPIQLKLNGKYNENALLFGSGGPSFGGGNDLKIHEFPATRLGGSAAFGHTYECPGGQYQSKYCRTYFAAAYDFAIADYMVYAIKTQ